MKTKDNGTSGDPGSGEIFRKFAGHISTATGTPAAFLIACLLIVLWALSGPIFHFSETWQLVVNTATTIITFLMVFVIQNAQNRETRAIQLKLDEIIRGAQGPRNKFVNLEELSDAELDKLYKEFQRLRKIES